MEREEAEGKYDNGEGFHVTIKGAPSVTMKEFVKLQSTPISKEKQGSYFRLCMQMVHGACCIVNLFPCVCNL